jgi:uncharacterized protein (DUF3084 family)
VRQRDQELKTQRQQLALQQRKISRQNQSLNQRQKQLKQLAQEQKQLQAEINQRDDKIQSLDQAIAQRDQNLSRREEQLKQLESQFLTLTRQLENLQESYQQFREGKIAIVKGQLLAFALIRIDDPNLTVQVINQLLNKANQSALEQTRANPETTSEPIVKITNFQVKQLIDQIQDGQEYIVRILSANNYVTGEKEVRVVADVALNRKIYEAGTTLSSLSIKSDNFDEEGIQQSLDLLLSTAQFRARRAGILGSIQVEEGKLQTLLKFVEELIKLEEPITTIKTVAEITLMLPVL